MKSLFKLKPKRIVTLDVGSHTIKLADFSIKKKLIPVLEHFSTLPVPDNCMEQGDLINAEPLKEILPDFISQCTKGTISNIYVSMSGRSIIVKKMEILQSEEKLMDTFVHEEIKQNFPFDVNEINYNYMPISNYMADNKNKVNILLVAVKEESVEKINQMIESMGYKCQVIDMCAFALANCIKFIEPEIIKRDENTLVLDIGKSGTMFIVLKRGDLIFSRYILAGSDFYTVCLMKEMGVEYQEAESLKLSWCAGEEAPPEVSRFMEKNMHDFCEEIFVGCEYFKNQFPEEEFSQIYVTGGGGKIANLMTTIEKKFNLPVHLLNPFDGVGVQVNESLEGVMNDIKYFTPACVGTCLRGLNV